MKTKRRLSALSLALLSLTGAFSACVFQEEDDDPELTQASASVAAFDFYFDPTTVFFERAVEATVTLQNNGSVAHSFTVPDLDVEVEVEPGSEASTTFVTPDEPLAYEFFCKFHPEEMSGSLSIGTDETFQEEDLTDSEVDPAETELD